MRNKSIAQRVKAQVIKKHKEDIGSEEVPKQIYNNNNNPSIMKGQHNAYFNLRIFRCKWSKKVQADKDQEKVQLVKDSHSKN